MSESDFSRPAGSPVGTSGNPPSFTPQTVDAEPSGSSSIPTAASQVVTHAGEAGKDLAREAEERAGDLAREAADRARGLMDQARSEVTEQFSSQQQRLAENLRSIGAELSRMGDASDDPGYATDLVRQGSYTASRLARWFEDREPGDVLREVQDYARRRPGMFLAVAAGAGVLAGRLLRGVKAASDQPSGVTRVPVAARQSQPSPAGQPVAGAAGVAPTTEGGSGYVPGT
jgi:ElaB/YqjD/DUF883 family membrane-anchored ribosome-binding protein